MQQKISINEETYQKIKIFAAKEYRSINKELEYIIKIYEDYFMTPYPGQITRPGSPNPDSINPADPLKLTFTDNTNTTTSITTDNTTDSSQNRYGIQSRRV